MPDDARGYSQKGAHQEKEKDMEIIKDKENAIPVEERVASLEKKMKDMEALVKGLTEELLDLKSITMRMNKVSEERRAELRMSKTPTAAPGGQSTVVVPRKPASPPPVRAPQAPPVEPEKMDMIMQPDGTLKPEKRKSSDYIVASAAYTKKSKPGQSGGKSSDLIVAEEEESEKK